MKFSQLSIHSLLVLFLFNIAEKAGASAWIAFGEIRGHLEPCGCDPATDLGGVARLSKFIELERQRTPGLLVFNLGNSFSGNQSEVQILKNAAISNVLEKISPDVTLYNRAELMFGMPKEPSKKFVLSNLTDFKKSPGFVVNKSIIAGGYEVFGFVEPFKGGFNLEPFSRALFAKMEVKSIPSRRTVLLYNGRKETLYKIQNLKIFDEIIISNTLPLDQEFADQERKDEDSLVIRNAGSEVALRVPLGAQGILLSKELQFKDIVLPLSKMLEMKDEKGKLPGCSVFAGSSCLTEEKPLMNLTRHFVAWIGKQYEGDFSKEVFDIIKSYRDKSENLTKSIAEKRLKDLVDSNFSGSSKCESCHSQAYQVWKKSKHASAFKTLQDLKRTQDSECVSCHVLGFHEKGGFVSEEKSGDFVNVQCESCHGPRKGHILNPTQKAKANLNPEKICLSCHTPPHSPKFNFKSYWESIKHK